MNAIDTIRNWCSGNGYSFSYGNPYHVNVWMGETDFSASTDGVSVYCYLLTGSDYDGNRDTYNVGIFFATLVDFDFNNETIDGVTEDLKERAKTLLNDLAAGNAVGWSGARFEYGYDDFAENVCWCCLRVTLESLAAECVEYEPSPSPVKSYDIFCPQIITLNTYQYQRGRVSPILSGTANVWATLAVKNYTTNLAFVFWIGDKRVSSQQIVYNGTITESNIQDWKNAMPSGRPMTQETEDWLRERIGRELITRIYNTGVVTLPEYMLAAFSGTNFENKVIDTTM